VPLLRISAVGTYQIPVSPRNVVVVGRSSSDAALRNADWALLAGESGLCARAGVDQISMASVAMSEAPTSFFVGVVDARARRTTTVMNRIIH
jgi:hypothetical protein